MSMRVMRSIAATSVLALAVTGLACLVIVLPGCASVRDAWTANQIERELNRPLALREFQSAD